MYCIYIYIYVLYVYIYIYVIHIYIYIIYIYIYINIYTGPLPLADRHRDDDPHHLHALLLRDVRAEVGVRSRTGYRPHPL